MEMAQEEIGLLVKTQGPEFKCSELRKGHFLLSIIHSWTPAQGMVLPMVRVGFPPSVNTM